MPYKVPEIGRVTEVPAVVKRERALVGEKVITSPPARVMEFVARVVESETVRVFKLVIESVPVLEVRVMPLTELVRILVADSVSVANVKSASSERSPAIPAKVNLVGVS